MVNKIFPSTIPNWIDGKELTTAGNELFPKLDPVNGELLCQVARSKGADIKNAVQVARRVQPEWGYLPVIKRGKILHDIVALLKQNSTTVAGVVASETGKSLKDALAETQGAIDLGLFFAGEGQRFYGRTTSSGVADRLAMTVREPMGVAGLIVAANTPIANIAWKVFPALICGNAVVLKAAEDTPATAWLFAKIAHDAGLPPGILNVVQGYGREAGAALVADPGIDVISFTGSTAVGREIAVVAGRRLAKVSLELGGKNPLVVCADADLDNAVKWTLLSAFSNAGQRCAAAGRVIVFAAVYDDFKNRLLAKAEKLKVGSSDDDDFGPVINERQLKNMLAAVDGVRKRGAAVLCGGRRLDDHAHAKGFYLGPTILENVAAHDEISCTELFGPITALYRVEDFASALSMANDSPYGLTACIHTASIHRALQFVRRVQAGVAMVNAGTYGSEPHMPFGGVKQSGNGSREPGSEALDIYSNLKDVYISMDPLKV